MRVTGWIALTLLTLALGCRNLGVPRVALEETSPDGQYIAQVRNRISIDPPHQALWIGGGDRGAATKVLELSEDQDWCNVIAWSEDGSTVAFLVQDAELVVFDAATRRQRLRRWLVERKGYPTIKEVRELRLAPDGSAASYRECGRCTEECSGRLQLGLPPVGRERGGGAAARSW